MSTPQEQTAPRRRSKPPTATDLAQTVTHGELELAAAERDRDAVRARLPELVAAGDEQRVNECRREILVAEGRVREASEALTTSREAFAIATKRERRAAHERAFSEARAAVHRTAGAVEHLEDALVAFGQALVGACAALDDADRTFAGNNLSVDRFTLRNKLMGLVERALWLHTEERLGHPRGLENRYQLQIGGGASLKAAAAEYVRLELARAADQLGVPRPSRTA